MFKINLKSIHKYNPKGSHRNHCFEVTMQDGSTEIEYGTSESDVRMSMYTRKPNNKVSFIEQLN